MFQNRWAAYLDIVPLVIEARFSEQAVLDNAMNIQHIEHWIRILCVTRIGELDFFVFFFARRLLNLPFEQNVDCTLDKLAVKITTS